MKIELPDIVVFLALFFSVLYFYLERFGEIKYAILEHASQPSPIKKRKSVEVHEETITDFPLDIELPENMEEEYVTMNTEVQEETSNMDSIKKEIESTCNFVTTEQGIAALNNPSEITERLQTGFDMWEQRTGKKGMTYSELRELFG